MKRFPFPIGAAVPLYLAPMAGVSESPFRRLCRRFGADVVVTEFLSAEGIRRENEATISKLRFGPDERPIGVQIFGADPVAMGEAAAFVTDIFAPEFIDINFGCPVKKVVKRNGGSGCLKDLDLVQTVIRAVAKSTSLPVTCKIRSGWNEEMRDPVSIALRCQDAGVRAIALHPRTRTQMYSGRARWEEIAAVVQALDIPVLGNGDIKTPHDAIESLPEIIERPQRPRLRAEPVSADIDPGEGRRVRQAVEFRRAAVDELRAQLDGQRAGVAQRPYPPAEAIPGFEHDDVDAGLVKRVRRCEPGCTGTDDEHLGLHATHWHSLFDSTWNAMTAGAGQSKIRASCRIRSLAAWQLVRLRRPCSRLGVRHRIVNRRPQQPRPPLTRAPTTRETYGSLAITICKGGSRWS